MPLIYNTIPRVEEASKSLAELQASVLPELRALLVKYKLQSSFGIVLVHRHFDLINAEEQVVDLSGPDTVVSSVFTSGQPNAQVVDEYKLDVPDPFAVVPAKFLVRDELIPYEYKCVPKVQETQYSSRRSGLPPSFLKSWSNILGKYFAKDKMGLVDMLAEDDIEGFERSDAKRRLNIVTAHSLSAERRQYIPTMWQSDSSPNRPSRTCVCNGRHIEG